MTSDLDRLAARFSPGEPRRAGPLKDASAVLAPLAPHPTGLRLLFTRRAATLSSHPGQISFPGGHVEPGEAPLQAALREAREEIGLDPGDVRVLGHLTDVLTHRGVHVACYVGVLQPAALGEPPPRNDEVEEVLLVPIDRLLDPLRPAAPHAPEEPKDPLRDAVRDVVGYERRAFEGPVAVAERELHYWRLSDGTTLWGITAHLVAAFLERAYGWRPPGAPRIVRTRGEVLP